MLNILSVQRILLGLGVIAFVGAAAVGATGAFFNDTETSTGNTFAAGELDLRIDSEQHYNGNECIALVDEDGNTPPYVWSGQSTYPVPGTACDGTWALTDLQDGVHKFFNFDDVKPGDEGENTISIHLDSNPAWMCLDIETVSNDDVTCTEPENSAEGVGVCNNSIPSPTLDGDLAQGLEFFAWLDDGSIDGFQGISDPQEGDNIWQAGELPLFTNVVGPLSDTIGGVTYALADSSTGNGPIPPGMTQYIGLAWCAGNLDTPAPGTLTCDGSTLGNVAQSDSAVANVTFYVEQHRNNPNFLCTGREV